MDLSRDEKISFILKNEHEITVAVLSGHIPHDADKFQETRDKLKALRKEIYGDLLKNKIHRSVKQIF